MFKIICNVFLKNGRTSLNNNVLKSISTCCNNLKTNREVGNKKSFYSVLYCMFQVLKRLNKEYSAVCSLLKRSGVTNFTSFDKVLSSRQFHTTPQYNQEPPKNNNGQKKPNNNDDDKDKLSALLAKALLWMLTGYMVIAMISLMFPASNQPEVLLMIYLKLLFIEIYIHTDLN